MSQYILGIDPRVMLIWIINNVLNSFWDSFPQPSSNIYPPGWCFIYSVTSYTTFFKLIHADCLLLCFDSYYREIIRSLWCIGWVYDSLIKIWGDCPYFPALATGAVPNFGLSLPTSISIKFFPYFWWFI